ncbi:unnamed protein product [Rotaria magnacalcarata]|uniref:Uncharacterized protein n=2 Tax=Rotaria magnacalcarata TaxID=392030 RepID=A0A8S2MME9_9BILA|nr:unnamed protein product [Rotaria magnacalcarata]
MSVSPTRRRKGSDGRKPASEHTEMKNGTHGNKSTRTKSSSDEPTIARSKSYTKRHNSSNTHAHITRSGSDEPYIREYKDFAGVTIIIRTVVDPRAFASLDPNSKSNLQAMRRKSELSQSQANTQDKVERTEKADHAGTNNPTVTSKSDTSSGNSHDSAAGDKHH